MSLTETKKPASRAKAPFAKKAAAPKVTNGRKKRCDIHDPHAPLPPIINAEQATSHLSIRLATRSARKLQTKPRLSKITASGTRCLRSTPGKSALDF